MNPAHHLNRSRHYLNFTPANIGAGDYARAARALPVGQPRRNRRRRPLASSPRYPATPAPVRQSAGVRRPPPHIPNERTGSVPFQVVGALQSQGCRSCRSWIPAFAGTRNNQTT